MTQPLNHTPQDVERLRDGATPGPYRIHIVGEIAFVGRNKAQDIDNLEEVVATYYLHDLKPAARKKVLADAAFHSAAPTLAADNLTLHAQLAEARERIEALDSVAADVKLLRTDLLDETPVWDQFDKALNRVLSVFPSDPARALLSKEDQ